MQCPQCSSSNVHRTSPEKCVCRDCLNVFEAQVTEDEIQQKTTPKTKVKNSKKKISKPKRNDVIALVVIGSLVAVPSIFWWSNRDPYICSKRDRKQVSEQIEPLIQKLDDVTTLAGSTSRIALATPLSQMQEIRQQIRDLEVPRCAEPVKQDLLSATDSLLDAYLSFSANDSDFLVEMKFSNHEDDLEKAGITYQNMQDGISNYSVTLEMTEEQLAQESGARQTLGALNRGQQAFYLENQNFSASIDGLQLGIQGETNDYRYQLLLKPENSMVIHSAIPKTKGIRSFIGAVTFDPTQKTTQQITCVSEKVTDKLPELPMMNGSQLECAAGSVVPE